eukprot:539398_1
MANKIKTAAINSKTEPVGRRFRMQCVTGAWIYIPDDGPRHFRQKAPGRHGKELKPHVHDVDVFWEQWMELHLKCYPDEIENRLQNIIDCGATKQARESHVKNMEKEKKWIFGSTKKGAKEKKQFYLQCLATTILNAQKSLKLLQSKVKSVKSKRGRPPKSETKEPELDDNATISDPSSPAPSPAPPPPHSPLTIRKTHNSLFATPKSIYTPYNITQWNVQQAHITSNKLVKQYCGKDINAISFETSVTEIQVKQELETTPLQAANDLWWGEAFENANPIYKQMVNELLTIVRKGRLTNIKLPNSFKNLETDIKKLKPINTKAKILNEIIANEKNGNKNEKGILGVRSEKPMEISSANKRRKSNNSKSIPQNNSNSVGWE